MQTLGDPREHFWRVIKMAKAVDVDLSTALDEGAINIADYAQMIHACRGCTEVGKCDRLLADQPSVSDPPAYCENRKTFVSLRTGQQRPL